MAWVLVARGRPVVEGDAEGPLVAVERLSFYGDVDPERGVLRDGRPLKGRVLAVARTVGSTVGAYVVYALARRGLAPAAIVAEEADTVAIAGAVLAEVPLVTGVPFTRLERLEGGRVRVSRDGSVYAWAPGG